MPAAANNRLFHHADQLRRLQPIRGLVHVGAGAGIGDIHQWRNWNVADAILIEPDDALSGWIEPSLSANPGWRHVREWVSEADHSAKCFVTSNPAENGLIDPAFLAGIWPNLRTIEMRDVSTRPLDDLLGATDTGIRTDWLLIDCLPALTVLQGARNALDACTVIWVRVVLDEQLEELGQATLSAVDTYLEPLGFRRVALEEGLHPSVGEALFSRDWRAWLTPQIKSLERQVEQLSIQLDVERRRYAHLESDHARLRGDADQLVEKLEESSVRLSQLESASAQAAEEWKADRDALVMENATLLHANEDLNGRFEFVNSENEAQRNGLIERQKQIEELTAARDQEALRVQASQTALDEIRLSRDAQSDLAADREKQIEHLTIVHSQESKLAQERLAALEAMTLERDELKAKAREHQVLTDTLAREKTEQATRIEALEAERRDYAAKDERIAQLVAQHAETERRQQLLNEELLKAEAQIELIKDVLLREPGL